MLDKIRYLPPRALRYGEHTAQSADHVFLAQQLPPTSFQQIFTLHHRLQARTRARAGGGGGVLDIHTLRRLYRRCPAGDMYSFSTSIFLFPFTFCFSRIILAPLR